MSTIISFPVVEKVKNLGIIYRIKLLPVTEARSVRLRQEGFEEQRQERSSLSMTE